MRYTFYVVLLKEKIEMNVVTRTPLKLLALSCLFLGSASTFAEEATPPERVNHRNCAEHLQFLVTGVRNSGLSYSKSLEIVHQRASKFDPENTGYKVDENTAAFLNNYNPLTRGGADANWVSHDYGPSHYLNDKFFKDGEYKTSKLLSPAEIKANVEAMTPEELNSLPAIRKYDLMNGDFSMSATKYEIRVRGSERNPKPQGWEGFCNSMRFTGATCAEPTKVVTRKIPRTNLEIEFEPYDIKTILAAHYDLVSLYARMGDINRGARDSDPPNAGAFHIMLQSYKIIKEEHSELPFTAVFDVEPNAELWNEALQNWASDYTLATKLTQAQRRDWDAPTGATKFVDVNTSVDLTAEAGVVNSASRQRTVNGEGLNTESYSYRLYLDRSGTIVGGDWLKDTGRSFPDLVGFLNGAGRGTPYTDQNTVLGLLADSTTETEKINPGSPEHLQLLRDNR